MDRKWGARFVALGLTALAALLRFYHLGYHDLRGDESFSITFAKYDVSTLLQRLSVGEPHPPLYYLSLKAWMEVAGNSEVAARWPSAAAGIVTCSLAFAFWRRVGHPYWGLLSALLLAVNPYLIWNSQDARMYSLATAACLAAAYCGLGVAGIGRPARRLDYIAFSVVATVALYSHYVAAVAVASVGLVVLLRTLAKRPWQVAPVVATIGAGAMALLLFLPWLVIGLPALGSGYNGSFSSPDLGTALSNTLIVFAAGEAPAGSTRVWLACGLTTFALLGVVWLARRQPWVGALLVAYAALPFIALFLASRERAVFTERYLQLASPALFLLAAAGLGWLAGSAVRPRVGVALRRGTAIAAVLLFLGLTGSLLGGYYLDRWGEGPGQWRAFVRRVVAVAKPTDTVLVNHIDPSFYYYYKLLGGAAPLVLSPISQQESEAGLAAQLAGTVAPGLTVWFVPDESRLWDRQGQVRAWLESHSVNLGAEKTAGMELLRYRLPAASQPAVLFGDSVRLLACEARGGETVLKAGAEVTFDLRWQAEASLERELSASLQLLDADGHLAAQADGPPAGGKAPTTGWRVGEPVLDSRTLRLPATPGSYALAVALYEQAGVRRLAVPGFADNLARVGSLRLVP